MSIPLIEKEKPPARRGGRTHLKAIKKLIATTPVTERDRKRVRVVYLPETLADYLLTSISELGAGKDPISAFSLSQPRGQRKKERRDLLIAIAILRLCDEGATQAAAIAKVAPALSMSREGVRSAYRNGKRLAQVVEELSMQAGYAMPRRHQTLLEILQREYSVQTAISKAKQADKPKKSKI